jgi:alpha/beta hydrolase family protein
VDADGNGIAGIRMPDLTVPLATYTGWNLFNARSGPTDVISSMQGSYIPLARTAAERKRANDPRPSIEERYRSKDEYVAKVSAAAKKLVDERLLLPEDVATIAQNAARHWDYLASTPTSTSQADRRP